eukprot:CAMPEP_0179878952 /NCGR_PEP_ID=MMETSP0982-20121206/25836_1 /TAXON_ID=483367 /ORGANISM="non described non described, Strain CCMP 2436" /LENGTH=44 /DNA_ID= /DNA_START= /DNA_END= /DNA_ORIENTATION=
MRARVDPSALAANAHAKGRCCPCVSGRVDMWAAAAADTGAADTG